MRRWKNVAVVGTGLLGTSIGLALKRNALCESVIGIGRRRETLALAQQRGALSSSTTDLAEGVGNAELTIVCTPVDSIVSVVQQVARHAASGSLITDVGSTKAAIVRGLQGHCGNCAFVGSHPMAGGEQTGPGAASATLFQGRTVVVTPTDQTRSEDLRQISEFWKSLGAHVYPLSPEDHDQGVAITSHIPHLVAAALAATTPETLKSLVGDGWRDCTRVASGSLAIWKPIISQNLVPIAQGLAAVMEQLQRFQSAVERNATEEIESLLAEGKHRRDTLGS